CPECEGRRFQPHVLAVRFGGKTIHELLAMTVSEAITFFGTPAGGSACDVGGSKLDVRCSAIAERLRFLEEVGLGYLALGQPLNILSGGESQRLKLVERLTNQSETNCLLIFDEPTTGLHF